MALFCRYAKIPVIILAVCIVAPILCGAQVAWVKSLDEALKQAAKDKKFIVLDISATW